MFAKVTRSIFLLASMHSAVVEQSLNRYQLVRYWIRTRQLPAALLAMRPLRTHPRLCSAQESTQILPVFTVFTLSHRTISSA